MSAIVLNLTGGPGVGKSTVAAGLFSELKQRKVSCEYVSEYAKEIVWEDTKKLLENQVHVFAEQFRRQFRLLNKVSYIITDSPLILNSVYFDLYNNKLKEPIFSEKYADLSRTFFDSTFMEFNNLVYYLERLDNYDQNGRIETLEEAKQLDDQIKYKLIDNKISYTSLFGNEQQNINRILYDLGV